MFVELIEAENINSDHIFRFLILTVYKNELLGQWIINNKFGYVLFDSYKVSFLSSEQLEMCFNLTANNYTS